jgi:hypothetical protein
VRHSDAVFQYPVDYPHSSAPLVRRYQSRVGDRSLGVCDGDAAFQSRIIGCRVALFWRRQRTLFYRGLCECFIFPYVDEGKKNRLVLNEWHRKCNRLLGCVRHPLILPYLETNGTNFSLPRGSEPTNSKLMHYLATTKGGPCRYLETNALLFTTNETNALLPLKRRRLGARPACRHAQWSKFWSCG